MLKFRARADDVVTARGVEEIERRARHVSRNFHRRQVAVIRKFNQTTVAHGGRDRGSDDRGIYGRRPVGRRRPSSRDGDRARYTFQLSERRRLLIARSIDTNLCLRRARQSHAAIIVRNKTAFIHVRVQRGARRREALVPERRDALGRPPRVGDGPERVEYSISAASALILLKSRRDESDWLPLDARRGIIVETRRFEGHMATPLVYFSIVRLST